MGATMRWILLALWVGANLGAAALAAAGWLPVTDRIDGWLAVQLLVVMLGVVGMIALAGCGLALGFAAVLAAFGARDARLILYLFPLALPLVLCTGSIPMIQRFPQRPELVLDAELRALAERSRGLTDALARYAEDHGAAPPALDALVPRYLNEIPSTGLECRPDYGYRVAGGMPEAIAGESAGEPRRHLCDTHFEVLVDLPLGPFRWDTFVYWPSEDYPDFLHGGCVERIGGWAYVHSTD